MKEQIENIINQLDSDKDFLLISLLQQKIKINYCSWSPKFTEEQIKRAKMSFRTVLHNIKNELYATNTKYQKAVRINNNNQCYTNNTPCKNAILTPSHFLNRDFYYKNDNNPVCASCRLRVNKILDFIEQEDVRFESIIETLATDEIIETFAAINLIKYKLKQLKQLKNDTSKHEITISHTMPNT